MRLTQILRFPERLLSTVHRGTAFEKRALALLTEHMSMSLTRVGGSYDGGIDLIGWWWVPGENPATFFHSSDPIDVAAKPRDWSMVNRRRLRVLAQCKAEKRKMGPGYLRELEGVVYKYGTSAIPDPPHRVSQTRPLSRDPSHPIGTTKSPSVALLVSESAFTRTCLLAAHASPLPFLLVHLPPSGPGTLGAVYGNPALVSARGVLRGELEIRWEHTAGHGAPPPPVDDNASASLSGRPGLWWQGQPLPSWTPDADAPQQHPA